MLRKIQAAGQTDLAKNNLVFFVGSIIAGGLSYLLYPVLSRFLDVDEFGEVQVLINFIVQFTLLFSVISLFVVNVATNLKGIQEVRSFIRNIEAVSLMISLAAGMLVLLVSPLLARWMQFDSAAPFWAVAAIIVVSAPVAIRHGFLRSQKAFEKASMAQAAQAGLRLVVASCAAALGLGVVGVMFGVALSMLLTLFFLIYLANTLNLLVVPRSLFSWSSFSLLKRQLLALKESARYFILISVVSFSVLTLLSIDSILAKSYFSPTDAGLYGSLSVVARIIFFATTSVSGVLLSSVKADEKFHDSVRKLIASGLLIMGIGGIAVAFMNWQPSLVVELLVGEKYTAFARLLPTVALAVYFISLSNLLFTYHIARRDMWISLVAIGGTLTTITMLIMGSGSLDELVSGFATGTGVMLSATVIWTLVWHIRHKPISN